VSAKTDGNALHYWHCAFARRTGTLVTVCHGEDEGLDVTDDGPWYTICEHGTIISHTSLALARSHAPEPDAWCEECADRKASR
jgi:hypothetical protein